jgi:hypothetical protein
MECRLGPLVPLPAPALLEAALLDADPAAIFDIDPAGGLRVATSLGVDELLVLLARLGCTVTRAQVEVRASICCGGCSG